MLTQAPPCGSSTVIMDLRQTLRALFQSGIIAADPRGRTAAAIMAHRSQIEAASRVHIIALGKAAVPMVEGALEYVGHKLAGALAVTYECVRTPNGVEVLFGGHPLPDERSILAGQRIAEAAAAVRAGDLLVCLISGGGSALAVLPVEGVTLADKIATNALLLASGAPITAMNVIRRDLSQLKGGGLAGMVNGAPILSLIMSDVPGDDIATIASGPTAVSSPGGLSGYDVAQQIGIWDDLPASVRWALKTRSARRRSGEVGCGDKVINRVIGSNDQSLRAMETVARQKIGPTMRLAGWLDGNVREAAERLHWYVRQHANPSTRIVLAGGETTVRLNGSGKGGRNQEFALYFALADRAQPLGRTWAFLSAGSDGRDGPTDSAGAVVDPGSLDWMDRQGIDLAAYLANNDSYSALAQSGDLLITGSTGTNVADFQILGLL